MDLRTKLVFALVSVSLASMLALALLGYGPARDVWRAGALEGIDALAESKQSDIENVVEAWRDRVRLIASRTRMRVLVAEINGTRSMAGRDAIARILRDAQSSVPDFGIREVTVFDIHGDALATTLDSGSDSVSRLDPAGEVAAARGVRLLGLSAGTFDDPEVRFAAALVWDDAVVGTLIVRMSAQELIDVTKNYTGLGSTGETMIATLDAAGSVRFLNSPRHELPDAAVLDDSDGRFPMVQALWGVDSTFYRGTVDYRGEAVWAATRYLPELELGLVVKFDTDEQEAPLRELRSTMTQLALAISGFVILVAILVGLHFAQPIRELAEVAEKIEAGHFDVRAPVRGEDEIGKLAQTFNRMTDRILASNRDLRRRIEEREHGAPPPSVGGPEDPNTGI